MDDILVRLANRHNKAPFVGPATSEIVDEITRLREKLGWAQSSEEVLRKLVQDGAARIRELEQAQFRWIPVGERMPTPGDADRHGDILIAREVGGAVERRNWENTHCITHWSSIPPLPEQSQEKSDDELWVDYALKVVPVGRTVTEEGLAAFKAGLKAARGEKS